MAYRLFAVAVGRRPGIYHSWAECNAQVKGFPNAVYKGFNDPNDAISYLKESGAQHFVAPEVYYW